MSTKRDILDILADYDIEVKHEGEVIRAYCPFHNDTGRPNFTVYPDTDSWYCFACHENGNSIAFVSKIEGISYSDAKRKLGGEVLELDELQDQIDGLGFSDDFIDMTDETNVLVSKRVRNFLKNHPDKAEEVLQYLKKFDNKLLVPINYNNMKKILEEVYLELKKLYN